MNWYLKSSLHKKLLVHCQIVFWWPTGWTRQTSRQWVPNCWTDCRRQRLANGEDQDKTDLQTTCNALVCSCVKYERCRQNNLQEQLDICFHALENARKQLQ